MITTDEQQPAQDRLDNTLRRVGLLAMMYYPEIHTEEPDTPSTPTSTGV